MVKQRRRSPKEIIESNSPRTEHAYVKLPGRTLKNVSGRCSPNLARTSARKFDRVMKSSKNGEYSHLHTHPYNGEYYSNIGLPSPIDIRAFLMGGERTMHIAQLNQKTREVEGYTTLRKTKQTKHMLSIPEERNTLEKTDIYEYPFDFENEGQLKDYMSQYGVRIKHTSAKGYMFYENSGSFGKRFSSSLDGRVVGALSVGSIISSLIFISSNLTGNVIGNLSLRITNMVGAGLFIAGVIGALFYFRKKK